MRSKIIKGSFILLIGFTFFNFLNFLYQSLMARYLTAQDYGILASLGAFVYIFSIFSESIQTVIAKSTVLSDEDGKTKNLIHRAIRKSKFYANRVIILYLVASLIIWYTFKIEFGLLLINGLLFYTVFLLPITRGVMQGQKKFTQLSLNITLEATFKIIFGLILVFLGLRVYGAIGGFLIGSVIAFGISFIPLKKIMHSGEKKFELINLNEYSRPTIFITAAIVVFSSIDILFAQIIFKTDPEMVGFYAISSILGKIVMWACVPIGKAMFPLTAESKEQSQKNKKIFATSLSLISLIVVFASIFFYFFSDLAVRLFSGRYISEASTVLPYLVVAFGIVAIANLILLYKLSIGNIKGYQSLGICVIIESILFLVLKNSITSFAISFLLSSVILLLWTLFFIRAKRHI